MQKKWKRDRKKLHSISHSCPNSKSKWILKTSELSLKALKNVLIRFLRNAWTRLLKSLQGGLSKGKQKKQTDFVSPIIWAAGEKCQWYKLCTEIFSLQEDAGSSGAYWSVKRLVFPSDSPFGNSEESFWPLYTQGWCRCGCTYHRAAVASDEHRPVQQNTSTWSSHTYTYTCKHNGNDNVQHNQRLQRRQHPQSRTMARPA